MPKGLTCRYGQDHLHFVTFSCYHRLPLLGSARSRDIFVEILGEVRDRHGFALAGYVVMPEQVMTQFGAGEHEPLPSPRTGGLYNSC